MSDLNTRLRIFSGLRAMGEPTASGENAPLFGAALFEAAADHIDALRAEVERLRADPRLALTHSDLLNASDEALDMAARSPCGPIRDGWVGSADRLRAAAAAMEGNDPAE